MLYAWKVAMKAFLFSVLFASLSLFAQTPDDDSQKSGLSGVVVNSATGVPVERVHLTLHMIPAAAPRGQQDVKKSPSYSATSDSEGKYAFVKVEPGSYTLQAQKGGFESFT